MSLGAFLTDESKLQLSQGSLVIVLIFLQRWVHGLMRWRICQSVSLQCYLMSVSCANVTFHSWYELPLISSKHKGIPQY
jgi:hypothetical protein